MDSSDGISQQMLTTMKGETFLDTLLNTNLFGFIESFKTLTPQNRSIAEVLLRDTINSHKDGKIVWRKILKSHHPDGEAFYKNHKNYRKKNIGLSWEQIYDLGERYYAPLELALSMLNAVTLKYHADETEDMLDPVISIYEANKSFFWEKDNYDLSPNTKKILALIMESCEANNPIALEIYIDYLDNEIDIDDNSDARYYIKKLLELGECRSLKNNYLIKSAESHASIFVRNSMRTLKIASTILDEAVSIYVSVEEQIQLGKISRKSMINGCYDDHHLILQMTLEKIFGI